MFCLCSVCVLSTLFVLSTFSAPLTRVRPTLRCALRDAIKSSYRKLSMVYHPDKNSDPRAQLEYVQIRRAFETLTHPVQRDVYNIFGSEVLESCKHCATYRDYLVFSILPVVIRAGFALAINVAILYFSSRFYLSFWVLLWVAGLALVELHSIGLWGRAAGGGDWGDWGGRGGERGIDAMKGVGFVVLFAVGG